MSRTHLGFLAAALFVIGAAAFSLSAAKPEDFTAQQLDDIWKEVWKSGATASKEPKLEKLSEAQVLERMTGKWTVMFGVMPNKLTILLSTNRLVEVSGQETGTAWTKRGQWQVASDKLILFLKEDDIPSFIFSTGREFYIFDPWAKTMMSPLKRER